MIFLGHAVTLVVLYFLPTVHGGPGVRWRYTGGLDPSHWHVKFPHCGGKKQSPINVVTADVQLDKTLTSFDLSDFDKTGNCRMLLENVHGHTAEVIIEILGSDGVFVAGGGLPNKYQLKQFHFHWGKKDTRGSEHKVNGKAFPMEMHMVLNSAEFADFDTAVDKREGLAVLGFFFKVGAHNKYFDKILSHFDAIKQSDDKTEIPAFNVSSLLPRNMASFYRYDGSLTTPPCYESVIWTLFTEKIEISEKQLEKFRHLEKNHANKKREEHDIVDNFRPIQELNGRKVYTNDKAAIFR